jgi:hypothetical protein
LNFTLEKVFILSLERDICFVAVVFQETYFPYFKVFVVYGFVVGFVSVED